ncbi:unnamed protein product, partial [Rotaria sp. Silwood2]
MLILVFPPIVFTFMMAVTIPPFHEKFICGYVPIKLSNDVLFTSNLALQHTKLVLIPHAILHIRDYHGIISIRNNTHRPKIIPRNTSLGLISQSIKQFHVNAIHERTLNYRSFSSIPSSLFSCPHCAIRFYSETELYQHFLTCCNKHLLHENKTIEALVEHINDPTRRMTACP